MSLMYFNTEPHDDSDDEVVAPQQKRATTASRYGRRGDLADCQDVQVRQMIDWYFEVLAYFDGLGADFTPSSKATGKGNHPKSGVYSIIESLFWGHTHDSPKEPCGTWLERNFFGFIPEGVRRRHQLRNPFMDAQTKSEGVVNWWQEAGLWNDVLEAYGCNLYEDTVPGGRGGMRAFQTQNEHLVRSFQKFLTEPPDPKTCPLWDATRVNLLDSCREEAEFYHVSMAYEDMIMPWRPPKSIFHPRQLGTVTDLKRLLTKRVAANGAARQPDATQGRPSSFPFLKN